jgi:hypothetical protein
MESEKEERKKRKRNESVEIYQDEMGENEGRKWKYEKRIRNELRRAKARNGKEVAVRVIRFELKTRHVQGDRCTVE